MALPRDISPKWHKSTYSQEGGSNCVEAADVVDAVKVRDTKQLGRGPVLSLAPTAWRSFVVACKAGEFDLR